MVGTLELTSLATTGHKARKYSILYRLPVEGEVFGKDRFEVSVVDVKQIRGHVDIKIGRKNVCLVLRGTFSGGKLRGAVHENWSAPAGTTTFQFVPSE